MQDSENWFARRNHFVRKYTPENAPKQGFLPVCFNCTFKNQASSFAPRPASWKAGTLPLSYSRANT